MSVSYRQIAVNRLEEAGLTPTPNRILVVASLAAGSGPKSLMELEAELDTLHKSSIQRVLSLLVEHDVVHSMEDGRGVTCYELCNMPVDEAGEMHGNHLHTDLHPHFYCERCHKVYCFHDISLPEIELPAGFVAESVNYMIKGVCPECGSPDTY